MIEKRELNYSLSDVILLVKLCHLFIVFFKAISYTSGVDLFYHFCLHKLGIISSF
jgi:hypothetical protein